jgi:hypothetical protein
MYGAQNFIKKQVSSILMLNGIDRYNVSCLDAEGAIKFLNEIKIPIK